MRRVIGRLDDQELSESVDVASGAIVVIPGLNNKPTVMEPVIDAMTEAGFHCLRVSLYQSQPAEAITAERIADRWISQVSEAYDRLKTDYPKLPLFNLSYSIGALVSLRFLQESPSALFRRMALFAPAVILTRSAMLLNLITPIGFTRLGHVGVPSLAPDFVKARWATPLREYAAMLSLIKNVKSLVEAERIGRIQTQVFINQDDEVVSYRGTDEWIKRNRLRAWSLEHVPVKSHNFRHLTVSPRALDGATWDNVKRKLTAHFARTVSAHFSVSEHVVQQASSSPVTIAAGGKNGQDNLKHSHGGGVVETQH